MIFDINNKLVEESENLNLLNEEFIEGLKSNKYNIIFDLSSIEEEFNIPNENSHSMHLYIRTKKKTGAKHDCTVKLIVGKKYSHGSDLGLPFKVEKSKPHYSVWVGDGKQAKNIAKQYENKLTNPEKKFVKKVINDNYEDIIKYWDLDLDDPKDYQKAIDIENKVASKYGVDIIHEK